MPARTRQQAHHLHSPVRRHPQVPRARAIAERPGKPGPRAPFKIRHRHHTRRTGRQRQPHLAARHRARAVHTPDGDPRLRRRRIDQAKPPGLPRRLRRVQQRHLMTPRPTRHEIVHRRQKPVLNPQRTDIGQNGDVERGAEAQAPVPAARAGAQEKTLAGIALLKVVRVYDEAFKRIDPQGHRPVRRARVIDRLDAYAAGLARAVDDAQHALKVRARGRREQPHRMDRRRPVAAVHRSNRPARQIAHGPAARAHQQVHHLDRPVRRHHQPPPPRPVAERAAQTLAVARLELLRRHHARRPRRQRQAHGATRRGAIVIDPLDGHRSRRRAGIDQAQTAHLTPAAGRIEQCDPVPRTALRHHILHAAHQPGLRPAVGQDLDIEGTGQLQTPGSHARADARAEALLRIAFLEIAGIEMDRLAGPDGQRHRAMAQAGIVVGHDADRARFHRVIDDTHMADAAGGRRLGEQRYRD